MSVQSARIGVYELRVGITEAPPDPPDPPPDGETWPFPACPLGGEIPLETGLLWYENDEPNDNGSRGFVLSFHSYPYPIVHLDQPTVSATQTYYAAVSFGTPSSPLTPTFSIEHRNPTEVTLFQACKNSYLYFEDTSDGYWETRPVQIDWVNFSADLFDPALGGGLEILCAQAPPPNRYGDQGMGYGSYAGTSEDFDSFLASWNSGLQAYTAPELRPAEGDVIATITAVNQLPLTIPVPSGRALIFRTVNRDPLSVPLGTWVQHDVRVGFLDTDPAGAFKLLRDDTPSASGNIWTVAAASALRITSLFHETSFGGAPSVSGAVLIYRDPARLSGDTFRIPITAPFLWYTEDPEDTFFGGGMEVTLTAYAVDESELIGTSEENWQQYVKTWGSADVEARIGAELASVNLVTLDENTFDSGAGNFDVDVSGGRRLVYYKLSAVATPGFPTAGLHLPALLHSNPSVF